MPINTPHPLYSEMQGRWKRCRDAYDGEDAIKAAGEEYLPMLSSMKSASDPKYVAYKLRAMFYGATARTVETLIGMAVSKPPKIELPPSMEYLIDDATGTGVSLIDLIKQSIAEMFLTARQGILVDRAVDGSPPYLVTYGAQGWTNWSVADNALQWAVVHDPAWAVDPEDPFTQTQVDAFKLLGFDEKGNYTVTIHTKDGDEYKPSDPLVPSKRGTPLDYIPFVPVTPNGPTYAITKPPLLDMVNVNVAHFRNSADLEHGRHFTALPTPWFSGMSEAVDDNGNSTTTIEIGSEAAILIPDAGGQAGYLEFSGAGLKELREGMREKEEMMAVLGARVLEKQKKAAETAETTRLNKLNDNSVLMSIVGSVERAYTQALNMALEWEGVKGEAVVEFDKDALNITITPQMMTALVQARQANQISYESFFDYMQQGGIFGEARTVEEELDAITTSPVLLPTPSGADDDEEEAGVDAD